MQRIVPLAKISKAERLTVQGIEGWLHWCSAGFNSSEANQHVLDYVWKGFCSHRFIHGLAPFGALNRSTYEIKVN